jgi:hypothetical protein
LKVLLIESAIAQRVAVTSSAWLGPEAPNTTESERIAHFIEEKIIVFIGNKVSTCTKSGQR